MADRQKYVFAAELNTAGIEEAFKQIDKWAQEASNSIDQIFQNIGEVEGISQSLDEEKAAVEESAQDIKTTLAEALQVEPESIGVAEKVKEEGDEVREVVGEVKESLMDLSEQEFDISADDAIETTGELDRAIEGVAEALAQAREAGEGMLSDDAEHRTREQTEAVRESAEARREAAREGASADEEANEAAQRKEQTMIKLAASQLKAATAAGTLTRQMIDQEAANTTTLESFLASVQATSEAGDGYERFSEEIVNVAREASETIGSIAELSNAIEGSGQATEAQQEQFQQLSATLEDLEQRFQQESARLRQISEERKKAAQSQQEADNQSSASTQRSAQAQERAIQRMIRVFPDAAREITQLAAQYGRLNVSIDKSGNIMGEHGNQLRQLIARYPELRQEITRLAQEGGQTVEMSFDRASFAVGGMGDPLRAAGFLLDRLGARGAISLLELAKSAGVAAGVFGLMVIPIAALIRKIQQLVRQAIDGFKDLVRESIDVAAKFETIEQAFVSAFQGNEDAAIASMERIRRISRDLGEDVSDIARAFLGRVEDLDQMEDLINIAVALARTEPERTVDDARIALLNLMSGQPHSLIQRFNLFTSEDARQVRQLQEELGEIEGLIAGVTRVLERNGATLESLQGTYNVALGQMQERWRQLQNIMGQPIIIALTDQLGILSDVLEDKAFDVERLFSTLGEIMGEIISNLGRRLTAVVEGINVDDIVGAFNNLAIAVEVAAEQAVILTEFLANTKATGTTEGVARLTLAFRTLDEVSRSVAESWGELARSAALTRGDLHTFSGRLILIFDILGKLDGRFRMVSDTILKTRELFRMDKVFLSGIQSIALLSSSVTKHLGTLVLFSEKIDDVLKGQLSLEDAFVQSRERAEELGNSIILATNDALIEQSERLNRASDALEDYTLSSERASDAGEAMADAILQQQTLLEAQEEELRIRQEMEEEWLRFHEEAQDRLDNITIRHQRQQRETLIRNQERRADIMQRHFNSIEDLHLRHVNGLEDQEIDYGRRVRDIMRRAARREADFAQEQAKQREDLERKHRERLEDIRRRFDFQAQEAILANDALALRRIRRRMQFELDEERIKHGRSVDDVTRAAEDRREKLREQLRRELEDAEIANQDKLEDLHRTLQQRLEMQEINLERELERQTEAERRAREQAQRAHQDALEDYRRWWVAKHAETDEQMAEERNKWQRQVDTINRITAQLGGRGSGSGPGPRVSQGPSVNQLRQQAFQLAIRSGMGISEAQMTVQGMAEHQLTQFIRQLQRELGISPGPVRGRAFGGLMLPGIDYLVGERRPEVVRTLQPAMVYPNAMMFSPPAPMAATNVDNSRTLDAKVNLSNLFGLNDIQRREVGNMITNMMLSAARGV